MAGRCGTVPPGAGSPVKGQVGGGAVVVVVVGFAFTAALWAGADEQALTSSPASPAAASRLQARGCRNLLRRVSDFAIAGRRSYESYPCEWWDARSARARGPARRRGTFRRTGCPRRSPRARWA